MNVHQQIPYVTPQRKVMNAAFLDHIAAIQAAHMDSDRSIRFDTMTPGELRQNQRAAEGMAASLSLSFAKLIKAICETGTYDPISLADIMHPLTDGISNATYSEFRRVEDDAEEGARESIAMRQTWGAARLASMADAREQDQ